jgi:glycosyltransferase involved in cell wall biosynthesis
VLSLIDRVQLSGGAERLVVELASRVDRSRFTPFVCATRSGSDPLVLEQLEAAGVATHDLARKRTLEPRAWSQLVRLLRRERIDILHAHGFGSNAWGTVLGRLARVPVLVAHEHTWSFEGSAGRRFVDREVIARLADVFLAVSDEDRRKMIELEGIDPSRIQVLANGVPTPTVRAGADVRADLGIDRDAPMIGSVGNLRAQKAYHVLIRAAAKLRGDHPDLRVLIAGDGAERTRLEDLIAELGLEATVTLLGERRDVPELVAALDVAVNSSDFEGTPLSVLEYMALGKAIVATRVGGTPALLSDGTHGVLVEPRDPAALASAIGALLRDPDRRRRLGEAAAARQRQQFGLDAMVARLEDLYVSLVAESPRAR